MFELVACGDRARPPNAINLMARQGCVEDIPQWAAAGRSVLPRSARIVAHLAVKWGTQIFLVENRTQRNPVRELFLSKFSSRLRQHLRAREGLAFHGLFYGLRVFAYKTAQFCETRCEYEMARNASVSNTAQLDENPRKNSSESEICCSVQS